MLFKDILIFKAIFFKLLDQNIHRCYLGRWMDTYVHTRVRDVNRSKVGDKNLIDI